MSSMTMATDNNGEFVTRAKRLKAATHDQHDTLDKRIMSADPFGDRARYATFLRIQYEFHNEIDPLYNHREIVRWIPDIEGRRRLDLIRQDILDLGGTIPNTVRSDYPADVPDAIGWLYVAEGSNLGAAFLLKEASKLGLNETFGARHLAGHVDGRGAHWRRFTSALDEIHLSPAGEARAVEGAKQAFIRVRALVDEHYLTTRDDERIANVASLKTSG